MERENEHTLLGATVVGCMFLAACANGEWDEFNGQGSEEPTAAGDGTAGGGAGASGATTGAGGGLTGSDPCPDQPDAPTDLSSCALWQCEQVSAPAYLTGSSMVKDVADGLVVSTAKNGFS